MTQGEKYEEKRRNFIVKVQKHFEFLVLELNFELQPIISHAQPNGTVILDEIIYKRKDKNVIISNAYHPVDYGFEINITDVESRTSKMIYELVKEKQDISQSYIVDASINLRDKIAF